MKINKIEIYQVDLPYINGTYKLSGGRTYDGFDATLVKITTDTGLDGWGESTPFGTNYIAAHAKGVRSGIEEIAPYILGMDPCHIDRINNVMDDHRIDIRNTKEVKSFVEKTSIGIEKGLTGIVGPNGCGKSNIVEALRWCMGETSAKSMRGAGMEDVIFSGTANKTSKNIAEVSLTLDNSDKNGPLQYKELDIINVKRRIAKQKAST